MTELKDKYDKILKKNYGYDHLKKEQFEIINNIVNNKKDILGILATGFGKSICYQMPYLITKKSVIVVSPLIALMTDQMEELKKLFGMHVISFKDLKIASNKSLCVVKFFLAKFLFSTF